MKRLGQDHVPWGRWLRYRTGALRSSLGPRVGRRPWPHFSSDGAAGHTRRRRGSGRRSQGSLTSAKHDEEEVTRVGAPAADVLAGLAVHNYVRPTSC